MRGVLLSAAVSLLLAGNGRADTQPLLKVSTDFPGGSARVERLDQEDRVIEIRPAGTAERGWVCWWCCRVEGARPGETLTLVVHGTSWATPDRASYSHDGKTWQHSGPGKRTQGAITYEVMAEGSAVWLAWGPRFALDDAQALLASLARVSPHARVIELCKSKEGRPVPGLRIEQPGVDEKDRLGIWVQARQHAWEAGSSWVCRGFLEWVVSDDPRAEALRKKATITVIPIMDVDNVEQGQGGKSQKPHDHNRDWSDDPVWPEVRAAIAAIKAQDARGRFDLFVDLHNPGAGDRQPFFFIAPRDTLSARSRRNLDSFLQAARLEMRGPLSLAPAPRESGQGYDPNWQRISKNYVMKHCRDHVVAVTLETAWNTPNSNPAGYRQVGRELGLAFERYFREPTRQD